MILNKLITPAPHSPWTKADYSAQYFRLIKTSNGRIFKWISGITSHVYYSDDNGVTWKSTEGSYSNITSIDYYDGHYIMTTYDGVYYGGSTNSGLTFVKNPNEIFTGAFYKVRHTSFGWIAVGTAGLFRSTDRSGYYSWSKLVSNTVTDVYETLDKDLVWLVPGSGPYGGIYKCTHGADITSGSSHNEITNSSNRDISNGNGIIMTPVKKRLLIPTKGKIDIYGLNETTGYMQWSEKEPISSQPEMQYRRPIITKAGRIILCTSMGGIVYTDDDGDTWVRDWGPTPPAGINYNGVDSIVETSTGRLLLAPSSFEGIYYSDPEYADVYDSKPLTKKEVQELITECKAYVQSKKQP